MSDARAHWEKVWTTRPEQEVGWFEADAATSRELVGSVAGSPEARVVDVGGGASRLVDGLLADGYRHVTVVDLSDAALAQARARLGPRAAEVTWLVADARGLRLPQRVDVWHDRAVFHFLTATADRDAYLASLEHALAPGGHVVVGTFGMRGPERCSGLPVQRYDAASLAAAFGAGFELARSFERVHHTPGGAAQEFTWAVLRRRPHSP